MIKVILFDFWGTLVENGVWSPIKQVKNILKIDLPFSEYVIRMEKAMMTSSFSKLKEAFIAVCREFDLEPEKETIETLVGLWNKNWMLAQPYEEVKEMLQDLQGKYKLVLISNTDNFSVTNVLEKFELKNYFDRIFFSFEVGMIKTDKNFFKHVLDEIRLNIEDCIMVGDSIQSDIMAAKKLGMTAILIDRRNTRDFHPKIKTLKELEKVLSL